MPPSILFLTGPEAPHNDNHQRIPQGFRDAHWKVHCHNHEELTLSQDLVTIKSKYIADYDVIWSIGLGRMCSFVDRMQLLSLLPQEKLMLPAHAPLLLHGKAAWLKQAPQTHISMDAGHLTTVMADHPGTWVLKPNAGSLGRSVHRVRKASQVRQIIGQATPQYWLLQHYVPEIEQGETRTLICGTAVIGSYLRLPNAQGITNLSAGGRAETTTLTATDRRLVQQVHQQLIQYGIGFAAIDTAGGYLIETNIANPGGLETLSRLYQRDFTRDVVNAVSARHHLDWPESTA